MRLVAVLFVMCALLLILIVLIQKGRGGGLSAAFGGGGAGGILGSKTGDFLTWVTIGAACLFLILAMVMAKYYRPSAADLESAEAAPLTAPADMNAEGPEMVDSNDAVVTPVDANAMAVTPADADTLNGVVETVVEEVNQAATTGPGAVESSLPTGVGQ
jgi:preprotein translocase subunit SecG